MRLFLICLTAIFAQYVAAQTAERAVYLADATGERIEIAQLTIATNGTYQVVMSEQAFTDHFLSMRPFKCIEGPSKHWCHVPYPYAIRRDISADLVDLEYDFLFIWKGATDYGIDTWNGVYYRLMPDGTGFAGQMHEVDLGALGIPPAAGDFRPLGIDDLHEAEPESHWLPRLVIE